MNTGLILWGATTSRTLRAHWALAELDLSYERRPIRPRTGETKTEEFTRLTARQKVPVLQDGGLVLTERCRHRRLPVGPLWKRGQPAVSARSNGTRNLLGMEFLCHLRT